MTNALSTDSDESGASHSAEEDAARTSMPTWAATIATRRINPGAMLAMLLALLAAQNLLLWRFLNFAPVWLYPIAVLALGIVALALVRGAAATQWQGPTIRSVLLLALVASCIYLLGGEGRLLYANADWQIRDAVLRDLIVHQWPFVYENPDPLVLRAPLGMFLLPALAGKALGPAAADWALLFQNGLLLTLLLGLGSTLFDRLRAPWIALVVVVAFSGMDVIGQLLRSLATGEAFPNHLERWAEIQYSSHLTQAFWVPQHALAGWLGALLFLLWHERKISLGAYYAVLPLTLLLSPLGTMGALFFAAYAGAATLFSRTLRPADVVLPAITTAIAVPSLLYLAAAGGSVGARLIGLPFERWLLFELLEVLPYLLGASIIATADRRWRGPLLLIAVCLLAMPFVQIGEGMDFTMRVSITALAVLSALIAKALVFAPDRDAPHRPLRTMLIVTLAIGSITGGFEVARALVHRPSPRVQCSLITAWDQVADLPVTTKATYFAPARALPQILHSPAVEVVPLAGQPRCWERPWMVRRGSAGKEQ